MFQVVASLLRFLAMPLGQAYIMRFQEHLIKAGAPPDLARIYANRYGPTASTHSAAG